MSSNWSDFLATPPNLDSPSNPIIPDFTNEVTPQAPNNFVLSSSQYSNIFQPSQQPSASNSCPFCCFQPNQQLLIHKTSIPNNNNFNYDTSDQNGAQNSPQNEKGTTNLSFNKLPYNRNVYFPNDTNNQQSHDPLPSDSSYTSISNDHSTPPSSPNATPTKNSPINSYQTNFNEIENRTLFISNLNPLMSLDEIKQIFDPNDLSKSIDMSNLQNNRSIFIEYFDLRQAQTIKKTMNGTMVNTSLGNVGPISVSYAPLKKIPDPRRPPNNGTIVVFHLPPGVSESHIESSFKTFGKIREIRGTPQKPGQRFIEYWDTRAAEAALNALNGKYVMGSKVSIEFSLPGGFRRNIQPYNSINNGDVQGKNFYNNGNFKPNNSNHSNPSFTFTVPSNLQNNKH